MKIKSISILTTTRSSSFCQVPTTSSSPPSFNLELMHAAFLRVYWRPLLLQIHPDLFTHQPHARQINAKSLQHITSLVEYLRDSHTSPHSNVTHLLTQPVHVYPRHTPSLHLVPALPFRLSDHFSQHLHTQNACLLQLMDICLVALSTQHLQQLFKPFRDQLHQIEAESKRPNEESSLKEIRQNVYEELTLSLQQESMTDAQASVRSERTRPKKEDGAAVHFLHRLRQTDWMQRQEEGSVEVQDAQGIQHMLQFMQSHPHILLDPVLTQEEQMAGLIRLWEHRTVLDWMSWSHLPLYVVHSHTISRKNSHSSEYKGVVIVPFDFKVGDMLMYLDQHLKRIELEFEHMMDSEKT